MQECISSTHRNLSFTGWEALGVAGGGGAANCKNCAKFLLNFPLHDVILKQIAQFWPKAGGEKLFSINFLN